MKSLRVLFGLVIGFLIGTYVVVYAVTTLVDAVGIFLAILLGFVLLPVFLALAPWYDAFANGDWYPIIIIYGGMLTLGLLTKWGKLL